MFISLVLPLSRFLNTVRVNAAPLPGFTNWNSTMVNGFPSISTLRPLRISDVSYMAAFVYPAPSQPVKPAVRRVNRGLAGWLAVCDILGVDAAAQYRQLLQLGRYEFLAAAAPAALVRYRGEFEEGAGGLS